MFRPVVVRLSSYPQPGICLGLQQALEGMRIGGRRTVKVPAALGFGDQTVLAPYAVVPGGSTVTYDIQLLRVSSVGPDLLVKVRHTQTGGTTLTQRQEQRAAAAPSTPSAALNVFALPPRSRSRVNCWRLYSRQCVFARTYALQCVPVSCTGHQPLWCWRGGSSSRWLQGHSARRVLLTQHSQQLALAARHPLQAAGSIGIGLLAVHFSGLHWVVAARGPRRMAVNEGQLSA